MTLVGRKDCDQSPTGYLVATGFPGGYDASKEMILSGNNIGDYWATGKTACLRDGLETPAPGWAYHQKQSREGWTDPEHNPSHCVLPTFPSYFVYSAEYKSNLNLNKI